MKLIQVHVWKSQVLRIDKSLRAEIGGLIEGSWWWIKPFSHGLGFTYYVSLHEGLAPKKKLGWL